MMILDAINTAQNEHAVYFLVTAYLESLQHFPRGLGLPKSVMQLPISAGLVSGPRSAPVFRLI